MTRNVYTHIYIPTHAHMSYIQIMHVEGKLFCGLGGLVQDGNVNVYYGWMKWAAIRTRTWDMCNEKRFTAKLLQNKMNGARVNGMYIVAAAHSEEAPPNSIWTPFVFISYCSVLWICTVHCILKCTGRFVYVFKIEVIFLQRIYWSGFESFAEYSNAPLFGSAYGQIRDQRESTCAVQNSR